MTRALNFSRLSLKRNYISFQVGVKLLSDPLPPGPLMPRRTNLAPAKAKKTCVDREQKRFAFAPCCCHDYSLIGASLNYEDNFSKFIRDRHERP